MDETRTRDGARVKIFSRDLGGYIFGAYFDGVDTWYPHRWDKSGRVHETHETSLDLMV